MPILQAHKNRVYTEIALSFPNLGCTLDLMKRLKIQTQQTLLILHRLRMLALICLAYWLVIHLFLTVAPVQMRTVKNFRTNGLFISGPAGGNMEILTGETSHHPILSLPEKGFYVVELMLSDGKKFSEPDTVMVEAVANVQVCVAGKKLAIWSAKPKEGNHSQL
ncbi:MAG: hypothetical protein ACJAYK_001375 [Crocinitomicaceae bacterium]|jgi:hypothetical protein